MSHGDGRRFLISKRREKSSLPVNGIREWCILFIISNANMVLCFYLDDRLIVASQYEPYSIVEKLVSYLAGSAHIVVQSPYLQVDLFPLALTVVFPVQIFIRTDVM